MFLDARNLPPDAVVETDVCIVGGGAAGIVLARELCGQPFRVALLEAGGLDAASAEPALHEGEIVGIPYYPLDRARLRYFGGSTNHWGGWSRPLDPLDFESRPWIPHSGWPIARRDLDPYYERANEACGLGPCRYDFASWEAALARAGRRAPRFDPARLRDLIFHVIADERLRFGETFGPELRAASNLDVYLHASALEIETDDAGGSVRAVRFAGPGGKRFRVAAKQFVLASGGLEIPRILLLSNRSRPNGLGNDHDLVGRFFQEHPHLRSGLALFRRPWRFATARPVRIGSSLVVECLGVPPELQRSERLPNIGIRLLPVIGEWLAEVRASGLGKSAGLLLRDWRQVAFAVSRKFLRFPSGDVSYGLKYRHYAVHYTWEQIPDAASRVRLSAQRDALGQQRLQLDWRMGSPDRDAFLAAQRIVQEAIEGPGLGAVGDACEKEEWETVLRESEEWIDEIVVRRNNQHLATLVPFEEARERPLIGSYHHLGTTKMSDDPKRGVVDRHARVHGVENLSIAGGSVFPTGGISNPTLTILALAIRLGDRIKDRMAGRAGD
ncbi:MAG TPA: GMC family oxidoreductase [Thermoanaerobaculia bacterium]|jgi:choline dehydrogenase-like flavoprotein